MSPMGFITVFFDENKNKNHSHERMKLTIVEM
jgi:hypothetical protein